MDLAPVIDRLKTRVADLGGRVEGAADLANLMRSNALPQVTPAAHVLPTGLTGGRQTAYVGLYRQEVDRQIAVILTVRTHDATGARAMAAVAALIDAIVLALAGWQPADETGVFALRRATCVRFGEGTAVYQIDFSLPDQLRIPE